MIKRCCPIPSPCAAHLPVSKASRLQTEVSRSNRRPHMTRAGTTSPAAAWNAIWSGSSQTGSVKRVMRRPSLRRSEQPNPGGLQHQAEMPQFIGESCRDSCERLSGQENGLKASQSCCTVLMRPRRTWSPKMVGVYRPSGSFATKPSPAICSWTSIGMTRPPIA